MTTRNSRARRLVWIFGLSLAPSLSGCAQLVETGLRGLTEDMGGTFGAPRTVEVGPLSRPSAEGVTSEYQSAPTHDWVSGQTLTPFTPSHGLFATMSPTRVSCQAVPVGLAGVFSGPSGPSRHRLVELGPIDVGVAGPDGAFEDIFLTSRAAVAARAMRSGARMAGQGPFCGLGFSLYVSIGGNPEPVLLNR